MLQSHKFFAGKPMLYWLYSLLDINIFFYITFRSGVAFFLSFVITMFFMPRFIKWAKAKKAVQPIYDYAPVVHKKKSDTPTMGGIVFIAASFFAILISADLSNKYVLISLLTIILFSIIGVYDDIKKVIFKHNSSGLTSKTKFLLQTMFAFVVAWCLYVFDFPSDFYLPSVKSPIFDMGVLAIFFWTFIIVATSNAVNLTDGLDGLATVPSIFAILTLSTFIYISGHAILAHNLLFPKIVGVGEVSVVSSAIVGGLIGFLWYNANPADIFMGDSGSLTLGALLGLLAIFSKSEILLVLIGSVFVIETLSVIIQVFGYKTAKKRFFLMAPIHHHFELKNLAENKIIIRFWIIALLSNLIALLTIKIR